MNLIWTVVDFCDPILCPRVSDLYPKWYVFQGSISSSTTVNQNICIISTSILFLTNDVIDTFFFFLYKHWVVEEKETTKNIKKDLW